MSNVGVLLSSQCNLQTMTVVLGFFNLAFCLVFLSLQFLLSFLKVNNMKTKHLSQ